MEVRRYATSRQKACYQCSSAKLKCDRKPEGCTRCKLRAQRCVYSVKIPARSKKEQSLTTTVQVEHTTSRAETASGGWNLALQSPPDSESFFGEDGNSPNRSLIASPATEYDPVENQQRAGRDVEDKITIPKVQQSQIRSFDDSQLVCPIIPDDICNRWLLSYISTPDQKMKDYPKPVMQFMSRVLKSYAAVVVKGRSVPPFVHTSQLTTSSRINPLQTCLRLVRSCEKILPGKEDSVCETIQTEMNHISARISTSEQFDYLSTFQAYLIYTMVLNFYLEEVSRPFLREAMTKLQELACASSRQGLVCVVDEQSSRPSWESWMVAEAKRRTLYTMYMFDSVLSVKDGLPNYLGIELKGLPAPSEKNIWQAHYRTEWKTAYDAHTSAWKTRDLRIDELWPNPSNMEEHAIQERRCRVDRWLEDLDEFGIMLYAVTSCTHGS